MIEFTNIMTANTSILDLIRNLLNHFVNYTNQNIAKMCTGDKEYSPTFIFAPFALVGNERIKEWRIQIIFQYQKYIYNIMCP